MMRKSSVNYLMLERTKSHYEEIQHPNLDESRRSDAHKPRTMSYLLPEGPEKGGFSDGKFARWFVEFDEQKLRPILIRNYTIENVIM